MYLCAWKTSRCSIACPEVVLSCLRSINPSTQASITPSAKATRYWPVDVDEALRLWGGEGIYMFKTYVVPVSHGQMLLTTWLIMIDHDDSYIVSTAVMPYEGTIFRIHQTRFAWFTCWVAHDDPQICLQTSPNPPTPQEKKRSHVSNLPTKNISLSLVFPYLSGSFAVCHDPTNSMGKNTKKRAGSRVGVNCGQKWSANTVNTCVFCIHGLWNRGETHSF